MVSSSATDSLVSKKDSYHQAITELQAVYAMSAYDSILFGNKFKSFKNADSLFSDELTKTLHLLWSAADSANNGLPGFTGRLNTVIDSFVSTQAMLRNAMYLQNLGYIVTPDKPSFKPGLDSLCAEIKTTTDSAVNGLVQLLTDISNNNIPSIAYLVQEGYQLNHTKVPGTSGSVTYTFINRGSVPQTNVSFKINQPSGGYSINSSDSIFAGTIQPGQHFNVTYHFTAPAADSIGHYIIDVKADNGRVEDVTGAFYVIDPLKVYSVKSGNWDNPSTWSTEAVPTPANSVYIYHDVNVNVNATVLKATLSYPGIITVDPNKILTILE